jgi:hypothetical protein
VVRRRVSRGLFFAELLDLQRVVDGPWSMVHDTLTFNFIYETAGARIKSVERWDYLDPISFYHVHGLLKFSSIIVPFLHEFSLSFIRLVPSRPSLVVNVDQPIRRQDRSKYDDEDIQSP